MWLGTLLYLLVVMGMVSSSRRSEPCQDVRVVVVDSSDNYLLDENVLLSAIYEEFGSLKSQPMSAIDLDALERFVRLQPAVREVEVYQGEQGRLWVEVWQRMPILRVFTSSGESFYLDREASVVPLSSRFAARVLVANGRVEEHPAIGQKLASPAQGQEPSLLWRLYELASLVDGDPFWKAQLEQVYVDEQGRWELVPRVGLHTVMLGQPQELERKLARLRLFYQEAMPKVGWNRYKEIDLTYEDQVVGRLRE